MAACVWLAIRVEKRLDKIQEHTEYLPMLVKIVCIMQGINPRDLEKRDEDDAENSDGT